MLRALGIDTSNYTTSIAVVEDGKLIYDKKRILRVKTGEKGLRQSEALFQHVENLPEIMDSEYVKNINVVCVSTKPRPAEGSYMPVFKAGYSTAKCIAKVLNIPLIESSHQEGHIEAACRSIGFKYNNFIALHMSGGTSEVLWIEKDAEYKIRIIGGTRDISIGQLIDRAGVAMGIGFPCGKKIDEIACNANKGEIRIPSCVKDLYFNFSGQETKCLKLIGQGYNQSDISFAVMSCVAKTLDKIFNTIHKEYNLPVLLMGGVASSKFLRAYFNEYNYIHFSSPEFACDNATGLAYIGYENIRGC